jgi:hypothetical protein
MKAATEMQSAECDARLTEKNIASGLGLYRKLVLIGIAMLAIPIAGTAAEPATPQQASVRFDIPAQSLEDALIAYAGVTGVEVFIDHALAAGQRSSSVRGVYNVEDALRRMLATTGLEFRGAAERAYTLVEAPLQEPPAGGMPNWPADRKRFFTALQLAIRQTLCAQPETLPGQYRAAVAVWVDPTGHVEKARLLSENGRGGQDQSVNDEAPRRLVEDIQHLFIGQPPPSDLEQPVTFVILPRSSDRTGDCRS